MYEEEVLHRKDDEHFSAHVTVAVSPQFFGWLTGLGRYMRFCGRVVPSGITLSFAFSGNLSAMDITLLENQCVKLQGYEGWPPMLPFTEHPEYRYEDQALLVLTDRHAQEAFRGLTVQSSLLQKASPSSPGCTDH